MKIVSQLRKPERNLQENLFLVLIRQSCIVVLRPPATTTTAHTNAVALSGARHLSHAADSAAMTRLLQLRFVMQKVRQLFDLALQDLFCFVNTEG